MRKTLIILILLATILGFNKITDNLFNTPLHFPKTEYDFKKNPIIKNRVELGKKLFYDPILSYNNSISCASCHLSYTAFAHTDHQLSHGIYDSIGTRNAPTIQNLAWNKYFMWDGSISNLNILAHTPITNSKEMGETLNHITKKLNNSKIYKHLFQKAYKCSTINQQQVSDAIAQFLITIISSNSKYDRVINKLNKESFTEKEQRGYLIFKQNCSSCHTEPLFTNNSFENNGLEINKNLNDYGRYFITKNNDDSFKFKVPTLRNIEVSYPYMHDGRFQNLSMVLLHYTSNIYQQKNISKNLKQKINLNNEDKNCLIEFLKTLTDEMYLKNPLYQFELNKY